MSWPASRPLARTVLLLAGTWLLGIAVAVGIGYFAIGMVGNDLNNAAVAPMSENELHAAAAGTSPPPVPGTGEPATSTAPPPAAPPPPNAPTPTRITAPAGPRGTTTPPSTVSPQSRRFTTDGGVASASCAAGTVTLLYAYPNNGYTSEVSRDPAHIEIEFHSPARTVHLDLRCVNDVPTRVEDREHEEPE